MCQILLNIIKSNIKQYVTIIYSIQQETLINRNKHYGLNNNMSQ